MLFRMVLDMNNDQILISTAMLTAIYETSDRDSLSMIEPFVLHCIAKTTAPKNVVNEQEVLILMDSDCGFKNLPPLVLKKALMRLSNKTRKIARRDSPSGNFILEKSLDAEEQEYQRRLGEASAKLHRVATRLISYLSAHHTSVKAIDETEAKKWLSEFFSCNGYDIIENIDQLRTVTSKKGEYSNYLVARFVIHTNELEDKSQIQDIVSLTEGMMLSSAIYIADNNIKKFNNNLNALTVYADTAFLLFALGFKQPYQALGANALIKALQNQGAKVMCFENVFGELQGILTSYADNKSRLDKLTKPLEYFDEKGHTASEIRSISRRLKEILQKKLNVGVASDVSCLDANGELKQNKDCYIEYEGLKAKLKSKISGYQNFEQMLVNDVDSISWIELIRNGLKYSGLESCPALFLTTNHNLAKISNNFLGYKVYKQHICPVMTDTDLSALMWVRYGNVESDMPKYQLMMQALAAAEPTAEMMRVFKAALNRAEKDGTITEYEASEMRGDWYFYRELMELIGGNPDNIDEDSIKSIQQKNRLKYVAEVQAENAELTAEIAKIHKEYQVAIDGEKDDTKIKQTDIRNKLLRTIDDESADEAQRHSDRKLFKCKVLLGIIATIIFLCLIVFLVFSFVSESSSTAFKIISVVVNLFAVFSAWCTLKPIFAKLERLKDKWYSGAFEKIKEGKLEKSQSVLDLLEI